MWEEINECVQKAMRKNDFKNIFFHVVVCPVKVMISILTLLKLITKVLSIQMENSFQPNCDVLMSIQLAQATAMAICELFPIAEIHCRLNGSYIIPWDQKQPNCISTLLYLSFEAMVGMLCQIIWPFCLRQKLKRFLCIALHSNAQFSHALHANS